MTLSWRAQHRGARVVVTLMLVGGLGALSRVVPAHVAWVPLAMAVVVGLVLLWDLLRRVVTVVDGNGIRRVDRPFSFGGATVLPRASVVQLYTRAERGAQSNVSVKVSSGGSSDSEAPFARTSPPTWTKSLVDAEHETVFAVRACLRDGRDLLVAGPYPQQEQALWVEQEMERILRIEDTPVDGELPRPA